MSNHLRGTRLIRRYYIPWLKEVDAIIGSDVRLDLGAEYSWLTAWETGRSPRDAVHECLEDYEATTMECGHHDISKLALALCLMLPLMATPSNAGVKASGVEPIIKYSPDWCDIQQKKRHLKRWPKECGPPE